MSPAKHLLHRADRVFIRAVLRSAPNRQQVNRPGRPAAVTLAEPLAFRAGLVALLQSTTPGTPYLSSTATAPGSIMPTTSVTGVIDTDFAPYRDFYTRRVQRLERFKKARSFCCVVGDDESGLAPVPLPQLPTPPPAAAAPATTLDAKFNELRQKMVSKAVCDRRYLKSVFPAKTGRNLSGVDGLM